MDCKSTVSGTFRLGTSNPVNTSSFLGGVARNISENLGRVGANVQLFTVVGDDREGKEVLSKTAQYVDVIPSAELHGEATGTYTAILDEHGNMIVALADMSIYDLVDISLIEKRWAYVASSSIVLLDTNFPAEIIAYILTRCKTEGIPVGVVTVSIPKLSRLPQCLEGITWMILNREEAEALSGIALTKEEDFPLVGKAILNRGAEKVVITRGEKGLYYVTKDGEQGFVEGKPTEAVDVTGAGDSLAAGIIFGDSENLSAREACELGMSCAAITIQSEETVSPFLSRQALEQMREELYNH